MGGCSWTQRRAERKMVQEEDNKKICRGPPSCRIGAVLCSHLSPSSSSLFLPLSVPRAHSDVCTWSQRKNTPPQKKTTTRDSVDFALLFPRRKDMQQDDLSTLFVVSHVVCVSFCRRNPSKTLKPTGRLNTFLHVFTLS